MSTRFSSLGNSITNGGTFFNPANSIATPNTEAKKTILNAFSGLDLKLNSSGNVLVAEPKEKTPQQSAARLLIAQKNEQKQKQLLEEQQAELQRQGQKANMAVEVPRMSSALNQAMGSFNQEMDDSNEYLSQNQRKAKKGTKHYSSKALKKKQKNKERAENYSVKVTKRSSREQLKKARKEKYKRIY